MVGELVSASLLALVARRAGLTPRLNFRRPEPVRQFAGLVASDVGGGAVTRINPVVDQLMATFAGVIGGGTLLRYSNDIATLPTSLLQATLLPVLLSHLSDDFAARKLHEIRAIVRRALGSVVLILATLATVVGLLREPLLRFVFLRGQMDAAGVARMAHILPYHLVGLAPFGALLVLARAHIALKNSRIMVSMGILNASLNALFNVILVKWIGLEGLALSTSLMNLVIAIVFWFRLEAKLRREHATAAVSAG
jgi:putative peptidoglycan lipid II flippase